jgi:hypothetical protein
MGLMIVVVKRLSLALLTSILFVLAAQAQQTYTAASCNYSDVVSAVNQAGNGDTVTIPAGTCTWGTNSSSDSPLTITAGITLQGQGANSTVIIDNTLKGNANCQGTTDLIYLAPSSNVPARITGLTITGKPPTYNCGESADHIHLAGQSHQIRIDDITFNLGVTGINVGSDAWGVADHNTFNDANDVFPIAVHYEAWAGVGYWGDNSWAAADTFGQAGAWYVENNTFNLPGPSFPVGCFDEEFGGRIVFRFNSGCPFVGMHGLDSSGRARSGRQWEIYNNSFAAPPVNQFCNMYTGIFLRGGTGFIFNNNFTDTAASSSCAGSVTSVAYVTLAQVNSYRSTGGYAPWGYGATASTAGAAEGCDGRGPFDTNKGTVYASGTASTGSSLDNLLASNAGWTTNQWTAGYSLVNTTQGWGSIIVGNQSGSISTQAAQQPGEGVAHNWSSGDNFQILVSTPCLDQIGRGAGLLIQDSSGENGIPVLASTGAPGQANESSDPAYAWQNQHNGGSYIAAITSNNSPPILANRDYYDYASNFNGTTGTGSGTLANRPSSCTAGVGYWATDQGNWNQSGSGEQGEFFVCTATNTWSLYYTPYAYPHPLTQGSGSGSPLAPPQSLQAVAH